jgi:hypothetical protein
MLVSVQQSQLVDQDGSEREPSGGDQPLSGHLCVTVEDALELPALKFSIALERSSWKMRLTSTPASVCG